MSRNSSFLIPLFAFLFGISFNGNLPGQTTYRVNAEVGTPTGGGPGSEFDAVSSVLAFHSLTLAHGDVIEIVGLEDPGDPGNPYVYSAFPFPGSTGAGEAFPIKVNKAISIRRASVGGYPVVFGNEGGSSSELFHLELPIGSHVSFQFELKDLSLLGSNIGVKIFDAVQSSSAVGAKVKLQNIQFINNRTAVKIELDDKETVAPLIIRNCRVVDYALGLPVQYSEMAPRIGFDLSVKDEGNFPSFLSVDVDSLQILGDFADTDDFADSAIFKLTSFGKIDWVTGGGPFVLPTQVVLDIDGSVVDGHKESGGWNYGVFVNVEGDVSPIKLDSYRAGARVNLVGTDLRNFRSNAVDFGTNSTGWGLLTLSNAASVSFNGTPNQNQGPIGAGIYAHTLGGYLGVIGQSTGPGSVSFHASSNEAEGLFLDAKSTHDSDNVLFKFPEGVFLGLREANIAGNKSHGIFCEASENGVVGGTRFQVTGGGNPDICYQDRSLFVPNGQGYLENCRINNNSKAGIEVSLFEFLPSGKTKVTPSASFRIIDSVIWNNEEEGFNVLVNDIEEFDGRILTPIIHSTMADNGQATINMDWATASSGATMPAIFKQDACIYHTGNDPLRFVIWNSIFQRRFSSLLDFGGVFITETGLGQRLYLGNITNNPGNQVAARGCRGVVPMNQVSTYFRDQIDLFLGGQRNWVHSGYNLTQGTPYAGLISGMVPSSTDPYQYMLDPNGTTYDQKFATTMDSVGGISIPWIEWEYPMNESLVIPPDTSDRNAVGGSTGESDNDKGASNND